MYGQCGTTESRKPAGQARRHPRPDESGPGHYGTHAVSTIRPDTTDTDTGTDTGTGTGTGTGK